MKPDKMVQFFKVFIPGIGHPSIVFVDPGRQLSPCSPPPLINAGDGKDQCIKASPDHQPPCIKISPASSPALPTAPIFNEPPQPADVDFSFIDLPFPATENPSQISVADQDFFDDLLQHIDSDSSDDSSCELVDEILADVEMQSYYQSDSESSVLSSSPVLYNMDTYQAPPVSQPQASMPPQIYAAGPVEGSSPPAVWSTWTPSPVDSPVMEPVFGFDARNCGVASPGLQPHMYGTTSEFQRPVFEDLPCADTQQQPQIVQRQEAVVAEGWSSELRVQQVVSNSAPITSQSPHMYFATTVSNDRCSPVASSPSIGELTPPSSQECGKANASGTTAVRRPYHRIAPAASKDGDVPKYLRAVRHPDRKKCQNRDAAFRYRSKKKEENVAMETALNRLRQRKQELQDRVVGRKKEIAYLESLLDEINSNKSLQYSL